MYYIYYVFATSTMSISTNTHTAYNNAVSAPETPACLSSKEERQPRHLERINGNFLEVAFNQESRDSNC